MWVGGVGSGEFKVGEDRDGERKGEQEGAEYSAAVSRLADSVCSCSECTMRGRQEAAVKEQKEKGQRKARTSACECENVGLCSIFFFGGGLTRAYVQECKCEEFPLPFGEKKVERPASEENSILSCSNAVAANHQARMSNAVIL